MIRDFWIGMDDIQLDYQLMLSHAGCVTVHVDVTLHDRPRGFFHRYAAVHTIT